MGGFGGFFGVKLTPAVRPWGVAIGLLSLPRAVARNDERAPASANNPSPRHHSSRAGNLSLSCCNLRGLEASPLSAALSMFKVSSLRCQNNLQLTAAGLDSYLSQVA